MEKGTKRARLVNAGILAAAIAAIGILMVGGAGASGIGIGPLQPQAFASFSYTNGAGLNVTVHDHSYVLSSTGKSCAGITNVTISWGDGSTTAISCSGSATHTYAHEGFWLITDRIVAVLFYSGSNHTAKNAAAEQDYVGAIGGIGLG